MLRSAAVSSFKQNRLADFNVFKAQISVSLQFLRTVKSAEQIVKPGFPGKISLKIFIIKILAAQRQIDCHARHGGSMSGMTFLYDKPVKSLSHFKDCIPVHSGHLFFQLEQPVADIDRPRTVVSHADTGIDINKMR